MPDFDVLVSDDSTPKNTHADITPFPGPQDFKKPLTVSIHSAFTDIPIPDQQEKQVYP